MIDPEGATKLTTLATMLRLGYIQTEGTDVGSGSSNNNDNNYGVEGHELETERKGRIPGPAIIMPQLLTIQVE